VALKHRLTDQVHFHTHKKRAVSENNGYKS